MDFLIRIVERRRFRFIVIRWHYLGSCDIIYIYDGSVLVWKGIRINCYETKTIIMSCSIRVSPTQYNPEIERSLLSNRYVHYFKVGGYEVKSFLSSAVQGRLNILNSAGQPDIRTTVIMFLLLSDDYSVGTYYIFESYLSLTDFQAIFSSVFLIKERVATSHKNVNLPPLEYENFDSVCFDITMLANWIHKYPQHALSPMKKFTLSFPRLISDNTNSPYTVETRG